MKPRLRALISIFCWLGLGGAALADERVIAIKAGALIDVVHAKVLRDQMIIVAGEHIQAVGPVAATPIPPGAQLIDLSAATVLPGLIDTHTHLTYDAETSGIDSYAISIPRAALIGARNARATLRAGFTTVRNVGADGFSDVALRDAINNGDVPGPRLFVSGPMIGMTGGHCDDNALAPQYQFSAEGIADGPDAVRAMVRKNIKYGADLIKYCGTGGVFSVGDTPGATQYTQGEANAIVAEAHSAARTVAVHAHGAEGIKIAIRAGVDSIEHASLIDAEGLRMAKRAGTVLSMDIYNTDYTQAEGANNGVPETMLQKDRDIAEIQRENFRKAHKMGIKLSFGTDSGVYPHGLNARQFAVMVRYGMSPMEAIVAATETGAALLHHQDEFGALAPGMFADIIAVDRDPLTDVAALETPSFVMKGGIVYRGDADACAAAPSSWGCAP